MVFPVSAAILDQIDEYRRVLESNSKRLLPLVEWEPTPQFNVRVLNDTPGISTDTSMQPRTPNFFMPALGGRSNGTFLAKQLFCSATINSGNR